MTSSCKAGCAESSQSNAVPQATHSSPIRKCARPSHRADGGDLEPPKLALSRLPGRGVSHNLAPFFHALRDEPLKLPSSEPGAAAASRLVEWARGNPKGPVIGAENNGKISGRKGWTSAGAGGPVLRGEVGGEANGEAAKLPSSLRSSEHERERGLRLLPDTLAPSSSHGP